MKEKLLKEYINGDFKVFSYEFGGRIIKPLKENAKFEFPNAMDVCITKECDNGCPFCYNNSNKSGKHVDLETFKKIIGTYDGCEIAVGGGDVFTHPNLTEILEFCKERQIYPSLTINQNHLKKYKDKIIEYLQKDLIKSIGLSLINPSKWDEELYREISKTKEESITIHVIAGLLDLSYIPAIKGKKILILGYKDLGRGKGKYPAENIEWLKYDWLDTLKTKCPMIIFDNLAIEQLGIKERFTEEDWSAVYQGDDGNGTMYLDLVDNWFGVSSIVEGDQQIPLDTNKWIKEIYEILTHNTLQK